MKKLFILLALVIISFGCGRNNNTYPNSGLTLSNDEFEDISQDGNKFSVVITSNQDWNALCDQEWCTISPAVGESGTTTMVITVAANTSTKDRNALITISTATGSKNIEIEQNEFEQTSGITISQDDFDDLTSSATSDSTIIISTLAWSATSDQSWCTISPATADAGTTTMTISLIANSSTSDRDATITVTTATGFKEIDVEQEGAAATAGISISDDDFNNVASGGATLTTTITSGLNWTASSDETWCTISPTNGTTGSTTVTITVAENTSINDRDAEITFISSNDKEDIDIDQNGKVIDSGVVRSDTKFTNISSNGVTLTSTITCTKAWSVVVAEITDWCKVTPNSGEAGTFTLTISVEANTDTTTRSTVIYIVTDSGSEEIAISQEGES